MPPDRPLAPQRELSSAPRQCRGPEVGVDIVGDLRARTRGEVLEPQDDGYQAARAAYNALATGQPAYIFRPADVPDTLGNSTPSGRSRGTELIGVSGYVMTPFVA